MRFEEKTQELVAAAHYTSHILHDALTASVVVMICRGLESILAEPPHMGHVRQKFTNHISSGGQP